ncbi:hypothetical protein KSS87_001580 [Heliosperma pusillum]|nr:hypothetical protein KSS87_001580 [Heliosperma pusillum]
MAMRSASRIVTVSSIGRLPRYLSTSSGGKGGVLDDQERAQETIFIQKMERERLEKQKLKLDKENADKGKQAADKVVACLSKCYDCSGIFSLYELGLASRHLNSLTDALGDFESALRHDPNNKDVNRELHSLVDHLALNLNGKRVGYPFDPLASNKKGKSHVPCHEVTSKGTTCSEVGDVSCNTKVSMIADLGHAEDESGASSEEMDHINGTCPCLSTSGDGSIDSKHFSASCSSDPNNFIFTNKNHAYKKLHLSAQDYNSLLHGKNMEFFHPRSGAILRVRPLPPKNSTQTGTLHDNMSLEAAIPTSNPLSTDEVVPIFASPPEEHRETDCGLSKTVELVQEEVILQIDKKKRISFDSSSASKVSMVEYKFEAVRAFTSKQIRRVQVARHVVNLKKRPCVYVACLTSLRRYTKTIVAGRKTKRHEAHTIQFDEYYPPYKKCRLASSQWSTSNFSSVRWMSSSLGVYRALVFENG